MFYSCRLRTISLLAMLTLTSCSERTILHGFEDGGLHSQQASHYINIWFVHSHAQQLKLVAVKRNDAGSKERLKTAVQDLLSGPTAAEERAGIGTEIPRGTILLGIESKGRNIELNLSHRFALDGGTTSFQTRLAQLRKTVAQAAPGTDVYLSVEGKRLTVEEGEGIEVPQPINRIASQADEL